jgi:WD repeat-containing protein 76
LVPIHRFVDVYAASGEQLAQLGDEGITAVPAVAVMHPTKDWVAGGTASGKLCLWM